MKTVSRAAWRFSLCFLALGAPVAVYAQALPDQAAPSAAEQIPAPQFVQGEGETPWLFENSDIPVDPEWVFGEIDNGLRYATRLNGVPPGQVSIRIRIDAGSLHEEDSEQGFAHLLEHLLFRESQYLGPSQAIPTWQRLGASFGSDTNAETSPTHTVYKLDLPNASVAKVAESMKLLSGMVRAPALTQTNLSAEIPIVLAEKRERGGTGLRVAEQIRATLFAGQRLATRLPIGTEATLRGATPDAVQDFHTRWYRPENTVISLAGDIDPMLAAGLIEEWFADWQVAGDVTPAPDFGDPKAPAGSDPANPVGEVAVIVEADVPRSFTYAVLRPWRPVEDTIVYNEGLMMDGLALALINRRLEARARGGGNFLYAQVQQDDISRSTDATFVSFAPLDTDWRAALADVRGVIADALDAAPTEEEIAREVAEYDVNMASAVEQKAVQAGSALADNIVSAVDIRETTAGPETILAVFRGMRDKVTPDLILKHTRDLFTGAVVRATYVTPDASEADDQTLRLAMSEQIAADGSARLAANSIDFADLPPVGEPGEVVERRPTGLFDIEQVTFGNGVKALLWATDAEPGRVAVKVRFGAGFRTFDEADGPYIGLGRAALIGAGIGELGQEELDRLATGRKMGFDFAVEDGTFSFYAQTRRDDLADQLYLFAAKLGMPRWDENPVSRAIAGSRLSYESFETSPAAVLGRDLEYLLRNRDVRFRTPGPDVLASMTAQGFRETWEPVLSEGPIEVLIFGDFDADAAIESLSRSFGALPERASASDQVLARTPEFPAAQDSPQILTHRGDADQAAAVIAWPTGGGVDDLREGRQIEILSQLFNNRLLDALRERVGASYAPNVGASWPNDVATGGRITALAQLRPQDVPVFFDEAQKIAADLIANPVGEDELKLVTEPLSQAIKRSSTGNLFWLFQIEGATVDPRLIGLARSVGVDYSRTTPERMQQLAAKYFGRHDGWRLAVVPQSQIGGASGAAEPSGR